MRAPFRSLPWLSAALLLPAGASAAWDVNGEPVLPHETPGLLAAAWPAWVAVGASLAVLAWSLRLRVVARTRARELEQERNRGRRVDAELLASEARGRALFDGSRDLLFTLRTDGTIESLNAAFEALLAGQAQAWVGRHLGPLVLPADLPAALDLLARAARGERPPDLTLRLVDAAGGAVPFEFTVTARKDANGDVVGLAGAARDVRERERLEARLLQSQKLEALGRLAGGLAHDVNNVLTVIGMNAQLMRASRDPDAREAADEVEQAAARGAAMVRRMLAFARRSQPRKHDLDLNAVIREARGLLSRLVGDGGTLELDLSPEPLELIADVGLLEQVIVNLVVNARDALPRGGRLVIRTRGVTASKPGATGTPRACARLDVEEEGSGTDPASVPRLFEASFGTKEAEPGPGLELPIVSGIAAQHGGWVTVDPVPGRVSTCSVFLPLRPAGADPAQA